MATTSRVRLAFFALAIDLASAAWAQTPDHLKCYAIKDSHERLTYTADLNGLAPEPGCRIKTPAKMLCIETTKENVQPTPPATMAGSPAGRFACYKVKCPKTVVQPFDIVDQFGGRMVSPGRAKLLCAPLSMTTTTNTPPTTCGGLVPCCFGGQCILYCSLTCPDFGGSGCTLNAPCGSSSTSTATTSSSTTTIP
jgi:hypothetical protein